MFLPHFDVTCDLLLNRQTAAYQFVKKKPLKINLARFTDQLFCKIEREKLIFNVKLIFFVIVDINECDTDDPCRENGECVNEIGSYTCHCDNGYNFNMTYKECQGMHYFKITPNYFTIFNHQFF